MTPEALRRYLHEHIPLSVAMGVEPQVVSDDEVRLAAPLVARFGGAYVATVAADD